MAFTPGGGGNSSNKKSSFSPGGATKKKTSLIANGTSLDVTTLEGLQEFAKSKGIDATIKPKKLSFLQRLGRGLSALEPADAYYKGTYEGKNYATTYLKDVLTEAGSAITGRELRKDGPKKTFKDILVKEGMKDREGKLDAVDVAGLVGDIVTDPSTLFGGAIAKGVKIGAESVGKVGLKVGETILPKTTAAAVEAGIKVKDALGKAFVPAYKASEGLIDDVSSFKNKIADIKSDVGTEYGEVFSKLSKENQDDLVEGLFTSRKQFGVERNYKITDRESRIAKSAKETVKQINKELRDLKYNYKNNADTVSRISYLQSKLAEQQSKLEADLGMYLSDTIEPISKVVDTPMKAPAVPQSLLSDAKQALKYKTLDDYLISADSKAMDKKVLSGEMESLGYKGDIEESLGKFYADATGSSFVPSKVKEVTRNPGSSLQAAQKTLDDAIESSRGILSDDEIAKLQGQSYEDMADIEYKDVATAGITKNISRKQTSIRTLSQLKKPFETTKRRVMSAIQKLLTPKQRKTLERVTLPNLDEIPETLEGAEKLVREYIARVQEVLPEINIRNTPDLKIEELLEDFSSVVTKKITKQAERLPVLEGDLLRRNALQNIREAAKQVDNITKSKELSGATKLSETQDIINKTKTTLDDVVDIDLESSLDAVRKNEVAIERLSELKDTLSKAKKNVFADVTREMVEKFDRITPEKMFKDKETIKFFSEHLLPLLKKQKVKFSEKVGMAEDMLMESYFPAIKKTTTKNMMDTLRVGSESYLKQYKGILGKDDIISSAPEAYARRAFELEKDGITRAALNDWVKEYGVPLTQFKNTDEALANGYKVVKEKGIYGKEIGYMKEDDWRYISDMFDPSFQVINELAKTSGFDWITSLFKKSVTGLFLPFHVRNYMSGVIQNYEVMGPAALDPRNIALGNKLAATALSATDEGIDGMINLGGKDFPIKEIVDQFRDKFGVSSQYLADFGIENLDKLVLKKKMLGSIKGIDLPANPMEFTRVVGNFIETQQKMGAVVTAIRKGYSVDEALKFAEKAGFDYTKLTPFEKNVMRRLIPFYAFGRKNLELQLRTMAENPQRLGVLTKFGRSTGTPQSTEDSQVMPSWMRNRFMANVGSTENGLPQVIAGFGTPLEAVAQTAEGGLLGILSTLNPTLKVPLEKATGKDFFRKQDLKDVYSATEYSKAPKIIKDFLKVTPKETPIYKDGEPTGETRTVYVGDPERLHIARNLFTSRGVSYLNTLFGEEELSEIGRTIKATTGFKTYPIDEAEIKFFEDRDNYRDLTDLMKRLGLVATFSKTFVPKGDTEIKY